MATVSRSAGSAIGAIASASSSSSDGVPEMQSSRNSSSLLGK